MPVYIVVELTIHDRASYEQYAVAFPAVFRRHGGELLAVEEHPEVLEGEWRHTRTVLIRFADRAAAERWYRSPEYRAIARHRWNGATANVALLRGLP
jgi:uncharacterized protein (DUF1330 family)